MTFFSVEERERVHDRVLALADSDERVVAGAVVGSLAVGDGDRFSDLDLTFAVADGVSVEDVLADWTRRLEDEFQAVRLFDVTGLGALYRVFLLPGCLQLDLSFAPHARFGARTAIFRLLFGTAPEQPQLEPPPAVERALCRSLDPDELRRALSTAVEGLLREAGELGAPVEPQLRAVAERR